MRNCVGGMRDGVGKGDWVLDDGWGLRIRALGFAAGWCCGDEGWGMVLGLRAWLGSLRLGLGLAWGCGMGLGLED